MLNKIKKFIKIFFSFILISCSSNDIDLIVFNAKIYTVNPKFENVSAFAVKDGKFIDIGDDKLVSKYKSKSTLDAKGMFIFPGFIDSHTHVLNHFIYANNLTPSVNEKANALKKAQKLLFENGITTISEVGLNLDDIQLIDSLQKADELSIRVNGIINFSPENLEYFLEKGPFETEKIPIRSFKFILDTSSDSKFNSIQKEGIHEKNNSKNFVFSEEDFEKKCFRIANTGFQISTDADNNLSNSVIINSYKKALNGISDPRWRIENAIKINKLDFELLNSKFIPSIQFKNAKNGNAVNIDLIDWTGKLILGSDYPNNEIQPLITFHSAVSPKKNSVLEGSSNFQIKNSLSRSEALKGMTYWGAFANFEESKKGSISIGKFADFVILSRDIMEINTDLIPKTQIIATVLNGNLQYRINIDD